MGLVLSSSLAGVFGGSRESPEHPHGQAGVTWHSWGWRVRGDAAAGFRLHLTPILPKTPSRGLAASAPQPEQLESSPGCHRAEDIGAGGAPKGPWNPPYGSSTLTGVPAEPRQQLGGASEPPPRP